MTAIKSGHSPPNQLRIILKHRVTIKMKTDSFEVPLEKLKFLFLLSLQLFNLRVVDWQVFELAVSDWQVFGSAICD